MAHGWLLGSAWPKVLHHILNPIMRPQLPRLLIPTEQAVETLLFASCAPADQVHLSP